VYTIIIIDTTTCAGERNVSKKKKIRNVRSPVRRRSVRPILSRIEIASKFLRSHSRLMSATGWDRSPTRSIILTRARVTLLYYMISARAITPIVLCYYLCSYYLFVVIIIYAMIIIIVVVIFYYYCYCRRCRRPYSRIIRI